MLIVVGKRILRSTKKKKGREEETSYLETQNLEAKRKRDSEEGDSAGNLIAY